ncbi:nitronate monooxygenase [Mycolicibacterium hodleri]|uniref:Propionate 3-nitronate monooxygenase n=1 Tax=Mycolicibacterium hodleri TaxID=49897 RepID=A0A502E2W8_9MYCO|nr:nitronate monooxygenase [Mycolicibacterium hodleri]TPG31299.1 nitronate monooxygenase [Mycolicibacterium hodleri]
MSFDVRSLDKPVIVAPMAGGPTTPALAAAASTSGGLGFLAGGYLTAEEFAGRITEARGLTTGPLGVNLFVVRSSVARPEAIRQYALDLADESEQYGAHLGEARFDDDEWSAKLDIVMDLRPEVVSFTFGVPEAAECAQLRGAGVTMVATVTTLAEAEAAVARGVDVVAVQGPEAGGHRGTIDPGALPPTQPLSQLLRATTIALDVPVIAAGGLMTAVDVADVLVSGAAAAQLGTAFLLATEAGSSPVHRAALRDPQFTETVVTRCFSGRYARGLRNRFIDEHDAQAPLGYPEIHYLTSPVRAASIRAGDPHGANIWAGTGFQKATEGSVADIMASLV